MNVPLDDSPPAGVVSLSAKRYQKAPAKRRADWLSSALTDDRGRVLPVHANVLIGLRAAPELSDAFGFDEMLRAPMLMRRLPVAPGANSADEGPIPRPLRDTDVSTLQEWLQHSGLPKIGRETTHQAVDQRAQECAFHPVRNYLDALRWDNQPRVSTWLEYYLGAESSPYVAQIGKMFLIAMVARIFRPGVKADYMLVLEGDQGARKSTACGILAGEWFSDALPDIMHDKEASQHLRGKWLIEVAELSATSRAASEALKAFVSRDTERFRPSYGKKEVIEPRQCIFVGTTNRSSYLKDETGARRFWPVRVGMIDTDALQHDRDQLFAEAVELFRFGSAWWPDQNFEREHIRPQQETRYEADAWHDIVASYVRPLSRTAVAEIALQALNIERGKIGTTEQRRIAGILTALGWTPGKDWQGRFYAPPTAGN